MKRMIPELEMMKPRRKKSIIDKGRIFISMRTTIFLMTVTKKHKTSLRLKRKMI